MENLVLSFKVVLPLFLMMSLGYFIKQIHILDDHSVKQTNNMVFRVFLPTLIFSNIYHTDLHESFKPHLIIFGVSAVILCFFLTLGIICLIEKDNSKRGVLIQGIFRSNYIIFGVPVTIALYGSESGGLASMLAAFIIPLFNVLAVISLEIFKDSQIDVKKILKGVITNPLIIGSLLAVLLLTTGFKMPSVIDGVVVSIANIATPLALVILGASFTFSAVHGRIRQILIGVGGRLVAVPLFFLSIAVAMGYRGAELVVLLALLGSPCAVSSFTMAQQIGGDSELAGQLVVFGSLFSIVTMFFWIFILKQAAFI